MEEYIAQPESENPTLRMKHEVRQVITEEARSITMSMYQRRIGKYELRGHLGSGAVGEIWKAFDTQQHRNVLIKIIQVNAQAGGDFTSGFYREAQTLAALQHPNIVPILDFRISQSGSEAYLIMDYVEGQSLADYLDETAHQGKFLPSAEIVRLLTPIAAAVDYAHQHNVVHGALKPTAILLDRANAGRPQESPVQSTPLPPPQAGEPKIIDFGMNHMQNPLSVPLSDVHYISPEVAQGYAATNRSDIYSLGVILYEICTGTLPFQGDTQSDILMQHIHGVPMAPASINPHISPALAAVIMRSLARDPAARFSSATALAVAAARALNISTPGSSMSLSHPSLGVVNPPSLSGSLPQASQPLPATSAGDALDTMNSPTYLSPLPQRSQPLPAISAGDAQDTMNSPTYLSPLPQRSQPPPATSVSRTGPTLPQQAAVQPLPLPTAVAPAKKKQPNRLFIALAAALVIVLLAAGLGTYFYYGHPSAPPQTPIVGHAFFVSSGLVNLNSNQGITDEVQINLSNIPGPHPGKSYYAWLLSNQQINLPAILLGSLPLNHGQVTMLYVNPVHDNLLANYNHFLITEENANPAPINPSLDSSTWRYSASFSTVPNPTDLLDHFSLYDHLRHLLAQDPKLKLAGLTGGLDIWLYRNTSKILEAAGAARDSQPGCTPAQNNAACAFVLREMVRVLDYLDGINYVSRDLPPGMTPLYIDPVIARVALLEIDPVNQQPPGYLKHMGNHLRLITTSPGVTPVQRALAIRINQDINNVQGWLNAVHADAVKLVHMNNTQLSQPNALSILDDLFTQANYAFVGQFDPNTNSVKEGAVEVHYNIQRLATFDVTPCTTTNGKNSCA
jgi:serine/threonine protein kinase